MKRRRKKGDLYMFYCKIILYINLDLSTGVGKIDWPSIGRQRS